MARDSATIDEREIPEIQSEVGRRIRAIRQDQGVSLTDLAEAAEILPQSLCRIERKGTPHLPTIIRLARVLRVEAASLIF